MKKVYLILIIFASLFSSEVTHAGVLPFTDILPTSPYYAPVKSLYDNAIISDDGSHLFRPGDPIDRGSFVGLSVSVSCKKCITPSLEDIVRYTTSPFIDLRKDNPNYYCIAQAVDGGIVQGYNLDSEGNGKCEDGSVFQSPPFCLSNKTTRIEAAAMLLRQANLWNDDLNRTTVKTITIPDISDYWYGYAMKAISAGILKLDENSNLKPDEYITRGEFALMSAKMFDYNQCMKSTEKNTQASSIKIMSPKDEVLTKSAFAPGETFKLTPLVSGDPLGYSYTWNARDSVTGKSITITDPSLLSSALGTGDWYVELSVKDTSKNTLVSASTTTLLISDTSSPSGNISLIGNSGDGNINSAIESKSYPSVFLSSDTLNTSLGSAINFTSSTLGAGPMTYSWDFGDGTRIQSNLDASNISNVTTKSHIYDTPGIYTVTVTTTDANGLTAQTSMVIKIDGDTDTDKDGILDSDDVCPNISGAKNNKGCPVIETNAYSKGVDSGMLPVVKNTVNTNADIRIGSTITVIGSDSSTITGSTFSTGQSFTLAAQTSKPGNYTYEWIAKDSITGKTISGNGSSLSSSSLGSGNWNVSLNIRDGNTGVNLSQSATTVTIGDGGSLNGNPTLAGNGNASGGNGNISLGGNVIPSLSIGANTLTVGMGGSIAFNSSALGTGPLTYSWDFGDGSQTNTSSSNPTHTYSTPGVYMVTGFIKDANGKGVSASMMVNITRIDSDGDGVDDASDLCLNIIGPAINNGCPPVSSLLGSLENNVCMKNKAQDQGVIIATPVCDQCPCENRIEFSAPVRPCDILFPTILSKDLKNVYSRGGFYQLP